MGEFLWTVFCFVLAFIGIVNSWPVWVIVVLFVAGGAVYIDIGGNDWDVF